MPSPLRARVFTALLLAALVIVVLVWLPPQVAVIIIAAAIVAAGWEWAGFAGLTAVPARLGYAALVGGAYAGAELLARNPEWLQGLLRLAALWWLAALVFDLVFVWHLYIRQARVLDLMKEIMGTSWGETGHAPSQPGHS